jgi:hypothetical protein
MAGKRCAENDGEQGDRADLEPLPGLGAANLSGRNWHVHDLAPRLGAEPLGSSNAGQPREMSVSVCR